jgi:acyl carrier protein
MPKKDEIIRALCEVLAEVQQSTGRDNIQITDSTCPIGGLLDFDSLNAVEATVMVEQRLGIELDCVNVFVDAEGTKAISVAEAAANICDAIGSKV